MFNVPKAHTGRTPMTAREFAQRDESNGWRGHGALLFQRPRCNDEMRAVPLRSKMHRPRRRANPREGRVCPSRGHHDGKSEGMDNVRRRGATANGQALQSFHGRPTSTAASVFVRHGTVVQGPSWGMRHAAAMTAHPHPTGAS